MRISKHLLKTMAIALALGSATSCEKKSVTPVGINSKKNKTTTPTESNSPGDTASSEACIACGMG